MGDTPAIPFITAKNDKNLYDFMSAVKQWIEIREGRRGDKDNRFITLKESRVRVDEKISSLPVSSDSGTFIPDVTPPASASGLTLLSSGMGGVEIGWTKPADVDVLSYRVYGDVINSFNIASTALQGTVVAPATKFVHKWTHPLSTAYTWYYWIVVEDKTGNLSAPIGPLTVNASSGYDDGITRIVNALADAPIAKGVYFKTDKFQIAPADNISGVAPKAVFTVGLIEGVSAVGISGNVLIDGTVSAKAITADTITGDKIRATTAIVLSSGGTLTVGNNDVVLSSTPGGGAGDGRISVKDQTAGGNNRSLFWRGAFSHYNDVSGEVICQVPPRQMAMGIGKDGTQIEITGEYPMVPHVMAHIVMLKPSYAEAIHVAHPGPVTLTGYDAGRYQFQMYCFTTAAKGIEVMGIQPRVFLTYAYPSLPTTLWAPGSSSSLYYLGTLDSGGLAKLFVRVMYRCKTNSGYGIRGTITIHCGYESGGFVQTDTSTSEYDCYADQDWRSVWIRVTLNSPGRRAFKVSFTPAAFIASRYEGIGGRLEMYVDAAIGYNQTWNSNYIAGVGGYVAYS